MNENLKDSVVLTTVDQLSYYVIIYFQMASFEIIIVRSNIFI